MGYIEVDKKLDNDPYSGNGKDRNKLNVAGHRDDVDMDIAVVNGNKFYLLYTWEFDNPKLYRYTK